MAAQLRNAPLLTLAFTWLALALRLYRVSYQSLWRDEIDALRFATRALPELLETFKNPGQNGPLFFLALRPWLAIGGHSEFALRFPSAFAGTLAVPVVYLLARRLAGPWEAVIAACLMATAPYLIWYGQEAKMYAALTLLVPLTLLICLMAAEHGGWWWPLLYLLTGVLLYTHILAVLTVPVQALWLALWPDNKGVGRRAARVAVFLAVLVLPYLPLLRWQVPMWLSADVAGGHPFVALPGIAAALASGFGRGILAVREPATLLPAMLAVMAGLLLWPAGRPDVPASMRPGSWRPVVMLGAWLVLPPLLLYGISLRTPIFTDRYLIWCMPAFLVLMAMGIVALWRRWRPLGLGTLAALIVLNGVALWAQTSRPVKADFRAAVAFVRERWDPADLLLFQIPYARYTFMYYASGDPLAAAGMSWADGPYTNAGIQEASAAAQMAAATHGAPAVWLIASEVPLWDSRDLARKWMDVNGEVTHHADFERVSATRYSLGP